VTMRFPILRAIASQLLSIGLIMLMAQLAQRVEIGVFPAAIVVLQAGFAAGIGLALSLKRWWIVFNLLFGPLLAILIKADIHPSVYLAVFVVLLLLYSNSITKGVPLYLSGRASLVSIRDQLSNHKSSIRFVDLGCGLGSAVCFLSKVLRNHTFVGVENAPLVYAIAKVRSLFHSNLSVQFGSIWQIHWGDYDVVYCFLSPVPMPDVWKKAKAEMKPGSLLISNTFSIPDVPPQEVIEMNDWRRSKIFIWRM
jgi:SAM-dependent methyltransferase